jgi:hypothetical protein
VAGYDGVPQAPAPAPAPAPEAEAALTAAAAALTAAAAAEAAAAAQFIRGDFEKHVMGGDGNCGFRALSFLLYGTEDRHDEVRAMVCQFLKDNLQTLNYNWVFEPSHPFYTHCGGDVEEYLRLFATPCRNASDPQWIDTCTMQGAADCLGIIIRSWTRSGDLFLYFSETKPKAVGVHRVVNLLYTLDRHYDALTNSSAGDSIGEGLDGDAEAPLVVTRKQKARKFELNPHNEVRVDARPKAPNGWGALTITNSRSPSIKVRFRDVWGTNSNAPGADLIANWKIEVNGTRIDSGKIHTNFSSAGSRGHAQQCDEDGWCRITKFHPRPGVDTPAVGTCCLYAVVEAARPHFTHIVIDAARKVIPLLTAFGFVRILTSSMTFVLELGGKRLDVIDVEHDAVDLMTPSELKVPQLKRELAVLGLSNKGLKRELASRLRNARQEEQELELQASGQQELLKKGGDSSSRSKRKNESVVNKNHASVVNENHAAAQKAATKQAAALKSAQLQAAKNQAALRTAKKQTAAVAAKLKAVEVQLEKSKEQQRQLERSKAQRQLNLELSRTAESNKRKEDKDQAATQEQSKKRKEDKDQAATQEQSKKRNEDKDQAATQEQSKKRKEQSKEEKTGQKTVKKERKKRKKEKEKKSKKRILVPGMDLLSVMQAQAQLVAQAQAPLGMDVVSIMQAQARLHEAEARSERQLHATQLLERQQMERAGSMDLRHQQQNLHHQRMYLEQAASSSNNLNVQLLRCLGQK